MGFVESVKDMFGFGAYDDEDMFEDDYEYEDELDEEAPRAAHPFARKSQNRIVPMNPQQNQSKIMVLKPKCFNNSRAVADELRRRRPVIVDVGALDPDEARRVIDFISGTVYGVDGSMQKITSGIFVATPSQYDILGEVVKEKEEFNFNMI